MFIIRESVNINKIKPNRCTCNKCRKIIYPPSFICQNCWYQFTISPLIDYKYETQQKIQQLKQKANSNIFNKQSEQYKQHMIYEQRKSANNFLLSQIQQLRNHLLKLKLAKTFLQQSIQKKKIGLQHMQQLSKHYVSQYISLQFKTSNLIQNTNKKLQKLKNIKLNILKQFQMLESCSKCIEYNIQNSIIIKRTQLYLIEQDNEKILLVDRFYLKDLNQKNTKIVFYLLSILLWKLSISIQILGITLPYQINISEKHGVIRIGSKYINCNINKKQMIEQILGMVYVNIKYILSLKVRNRKQKQQFTISTQQIKQIIEQQYPKKERYKQQKQVEQKQPIYDIFSQTKSNSNSIIIITKSICIHMKMQYNSLIKRYINGKFEIYQQHDI